jgi:hypothetical protein
MNKAAIRQRPLQSPALPCLSRIQRGRINKHLDMIPYDSEGLKLFQKMAVASALPPPLHARWDGDNHRAHASQPARSTARGGAAQRHRRTLESARGRPVARRCHGPDAGRRPSGVPRVGPSDFGPRAARRRDRKAAAGAT